MATGEGRTGRPRGEYAKTSARKRAIVDAATMVFSQRGYHGGSLRDISREVGVSLAGIVHHFPTKSDLLEEVLAVADARAAASLAAADEDGQPLEAWVRDTVQANFERPEMLRMLAMLSAEASAPDHPAHEWFVHRYANVSVTIAARIRRDRERGYISIDRAPEELARILLALWDGLQLQWLLDPTIDVLGLMQLALEREFRAPAAQVTG